MTFGCQMNVNDSDWLARSLSAMGFEESPFEDARIIILNTCSVRDKPENKVYTELGRIRLLAREHPERGIFACVGGCVAQQVGTRLFHRSKELRLVFGTDGIAQAPEAIRLISGQPDKKITLLDFQSGYEEREPLIELGKPVSSAYVNIMQGCDNFCSYCIVPYVRGRQKSRKTAAVLEECTRAIEYGASEITLLGQNVNSFGQDKEGDGTSFTELLHKVAALPGLRRLRFITPHPKDLAPELIRAFGEIDILAPRLHLPLQSGSDRILKRMGRKYDLARYMDIVDKLREVRPDIQLSTDIIVGFPGESAADFEATLLAAQRADFAASFSFVYSDRPGTKAEKLKNKVERPLALERLSVLQDWQNSNTSIILNKMIGKSAEVLIEGQSLKPEMPGHESAGNEHAEANRAHISMHGRDAYGFSVNIAVDPASGVKPGDMASVRITGAARHTLKGELANVR